MRSTPDDDKSDHPLRRVPLFDGLTPRQLAQITKLMTTITVPAGRSLAQPDERGREFMLLKEGEAVIARFGRVIAIRGPGDYIGEIALLETQGRTSTIIAKTDVTAEVLSRASFASLLARAPGVASRLRANLEHRLAGLESDSGP